MTVWFDVEDLFDYASAGHRRVSGIQRLTLEIYRAAAGLGGVGFVRHAYGGGLFEVLDWSDVASQFPDQITPGAAPRVAAPPSPGQHANPAPEPAQPPRSGIRQVARRMADLVPPDVRGPLVLAVVTQAEAVAELGLFATGLGGRAVRRIAGLRPRATVRTPRTGRSFDALARPGDTLLVLGSPWFRQRYSEVARWARDERRMRFGVLMCDLVPVRRPEWCDEGIRRTFQAWYADVLPVCDLVMAISRFTADEVESYAAELGLALPRPVCVIPIGTGFGPPQPPPVFHPVPDTVPERPPLDPIDPRGSRRPLPAPGSYVLFVSTIEARKNHTLIVEVWRRLLAEVRAGTRDPASLPDLVFAGRVGWLVADLIQQLDNSDWLSGRVRLVDGPDDAALQALYDGCLFTVFPSLHEGWGLPVTESLARGAPCLCSGAASLPEAGRDLCRYFDPESVGSARDAVAAVLDDRPGLHAWRERVRREFRPVPWTDTAHAVLDEAAAAG